MNARIPTLLLAIAVLAGCESKYASTLPQKDPALRKTRLQFAVDAAKRAYPADAKRERTYDLRVQVGYSLNVIEIANLTNQDWTDLDVWVNKRYVIHVPSIKAHQLERLWFHGIFDSNGNSFPTDNSKVLVNTVEVFKDGVLYDLPPHLAD
jgi:hypothetical protein